MTVDVEYTAQIKQAAGLGRETLALDAPCPVSEVLRLIVARHGEAMAKLLLDSTGKLRPSVLLFVNDDQLGEGEDPQLSGGERVTLMSPISGG